MRFIDKNSINHKTLNDMNANKNQYNPASIVKKYEKRNLKIKHNKNQYLKFKSKIKFYIKMFK